MMYKYNVSQYCPVSYVGHQSLLYVLITVAFSTTFNITLLLAVLAFYTRLIDQQRCDVTAVIRLVLVLHSVH